MTAPATYRRPVSRLWWAKKPTYFLFLMREFSCVFVAWSAVFLMLLIYAIGRGESSYLRFLEWAASPVVVVVNIVALAFLLLHTVTWFALTPQAMAAESCRRRR
jgi:fumarate reductase subunit C